jgi:2-polyprenyl-3-methyl-5-hydroxy-6-metoxy-1,4-benzoquinol methylase
MERTKIKMTDQASGGYLSPWLKAQRLKKVSPFVRGHVLDYGCGTGDLLNYCRPASYFGYDLDQRSVETARLRHPGHTFSSDFSLVQNTDKRFDVIVMAAVIEHVESPLETLSALKRVLAEGSIFVLTTPHPHWRAIHDFGARVGIFSKEASQEHKTFLDRDRISMLREALGLKLLRSEVFLLGANQLFVIGN